MAAAPLDLTSWRWSAPLEWLWAEHRATLSTTFAYLFVKCAARLAAMARRGRPLSRSEASRDVWDPVCLLHNVLSVAAGCWSAYAWEAPAAESCAGGVSGPGAAIIRLQLAHCVSDFLCFLPQMLDEMVFVFHHAVLAGVSLVLPHCPGCYWTVVAFSIAEFGSGAVGLDAEWRKAGFRSRGLKRFVVFGLSRLVNLFLLREIWKVTPTIHIFSLSDESGAVVAKFSLPVCMITAVGGSGMMLAVNGVTCWRMFRSYRKQRAKRLRAKADKAP